MKTETSDFLQWIERCAAVLNESGRYGQSINYRKAGRSFARFIDECELRHPSLREISPALIKGYNIWLENTGIVRNSISFYNRQLRAMYNIAVRAGRIRDRRPFDNVYTGVAKTCKRAVSLKDISHICLVSGTVNETARDMFEFSFCACGMSFADMAYLRKSDIRDGTMTYNRRKTHAQVTLPLGKNAMRIIKKYSSLTPDSAYIFPIIGKAKGEKAYRRYLTALTSYNRALKEIARKAESHVSLTSYVARHSWASAARNTGAPISVISSALGHSNEKTTQIYLDSMDLSKIASVNRKIARDMLPFAIKNGSIKEPFSIGQR